MSAVDPHLLSDATERLLIQLERDGARIHLVEGGFVIHASRADLEKALEQAACEIHAYFPVQGEPHRSRRFLEMARKHLAGVREAQSPGRYFEAAPGASAENPAVIAAYDAVRLWEVEVARLERVSS